MKAGSRPAAGALYQPLGASDSRPRGLVVEDADPDLDLVSTDRRDGDRVEEILETVIALATDAAVQARAGALEPRPDTCTPQRACAYPGLCRCEAT